jgi:hypothetical protein
VAWYFHIVELDDGRWACRFGNHEYDTHGDLDAALEHTRAIASARRPAEIFIHRYGSTPERLAVLPADP